MPLTEYAWKFRYPGEPQEPSLEEGEEALAKAHHALEVAWKLQAGGNWPMLQGKAYYGFMRPRPS